MPAEMPRVAFASTDETRPEEADFPLIRDTLAGQGVSCEVRLWRDDAVPWQDFDLVLAIYTWGYPEALTEFLAWASRVSALSRLVNPYQLLEWNSDKVYLADLATDGVPTVPTLFVGAGEDWEPPALDFVVKPSVSAGGRGAARYVDSELSIARAHVTRLIEAGKTVMIQPYQSAVDAKGETALLHFCGSFSHAVSKQALLQPDIGELPSLWERQVIAPTEPRTDQLEVARQALSSAARRAAPAVYGRVDLVDDDRGNPQVLELEVFEPALFLSYDDAAAGRFAAALTSLLDERRAEPEPAASDQANC